MSYIGRHVSSLHTPALLVDKDQVADKEEFV
jgi:hypothetical protein